MDNEQLFELMTKMYSEMQEGFKELKNEVIEVKEELKGFREEANERFDNLEDKLIEMEGINASNHVVINTKLNKVSDDLDFLSHKEFQTEREMYLIKQRLSKQKKNVR